MLKNSLFVLLGCALGVALMYANDFRTQSVDAIPPGGGLEESFEALAQAVAGAGVFVRGHQWYGSPLEQAEAYRHILRATISALEITALGDPDFPFFHELNPYAKVGMDNADQRYLIAVLNGEATYRVWGSRGSSRRLDFTLYEESGSPMAPSFATLGTEQLQVDENGDFELYVGGPQRAGNWMPNGAGSTRLLIRQIHSDWANERPGQIHIDRVDAQRPLYPTMSPQKMAARLTKTANWLAADVRRWPEMSRTRFAMLMPANFLSPPQDTGSEGGLAGRWMVGGHFVLADDEALLITAKPTTAAYQAIQLGHHWWESFDYANRQSSLTLEQTRVSSDGALYYVVAKTDPGFANWLDTEGFDRGVILMRFDGMTAELRDDEIPSAQLVSLSDLPAYLPADEPRLTAAQRAKAIAVRREHVQRRFGF